MEHPLQDRTELLPQIEEFKCIRVLFTSEGRVVQEIAVMCECCTQQKELNMNTKLFTSQSPMVTTSG